MIYLLRVMIHEWVRSSTRTEQINVFTNMEGEGEGWNTVMLEPSNLLLTVPRRYIHYGTFCYMFCSVSLTNVFF